MYADSFEFWYAFYSYQYTFEFSEGENINKNSLGLEWAFFTPMSFNNVPVIYMAGINFTWGDNGNSINVYNNLHFNLYDLSGFYQPTLNQLYLVSGFNFSYNFDKNIIGISPEIGLAFFTFLKINILYRYNIYITINNTHEIALSIGFLDIFQSILFKSMQKKPYG